jgi:hypothetical protein
LWHGTFISQNPKPASDVCRFERAPNGQAIRILHSVNEGIYGGETQLCSMQKKGVRLSSNALALKLKLRGGECE